MTRRTTLKAAVAVALFAVALGANTLWNGFVFDDVQNIVQNRWIRGVRWLPQIFASDAAAFDPAFATSYYRPLMHVLYMATYHVFGLHPAGFHLVSVVLNAAVCVLAWATVRELFRQQGMGSEREPMALGAALLFAAHPVHAEVLAWLAGVTDLLFTLFGLASLLVYMTARHDDSRRSWAAAVLFFLALLCKEPAAALIAVIAVYEIAFRRATPARVLVRLVPFLAAGGFYVALRTWALGGFAPNGHHDAYGFTVSLLSAASLFARYVGKLIVPVPLNAFYEFHPTTSVDGSVLLGGAALVACGACAWLLRRQASVPVAVALIVGPLAPALYLPALGESVFAERYLYLPVLGFATLAALACSAVTRRWPRSLVPVVAVSAGLIGTCATMTVVRNATWRTSLTLWSDTAAKSPASAAAQGNLCYAQLVAGETQDAIRNCERSLELDPRRVDARVNLATAFLASGRLDDAEREFRTALEQRPNSPEACTSLGLIYMARGRPAQAIEAYTTALGYNPDYAEAHNDLGIALARTGQIQAAVDEFRKASALAPDSAEYAGNLASARRMVEAH